MTVSLNAFVATIIAGSGAQISLDELKELAQPFKASKLTWLQEGIAADLFCEGNSPVEILRQLKKLVGERTYDVIVQPEQGRRKKLLLADMESTIIEQEMLDELADIMGLRQKVADITRRAMNGELDFASALRERVLLLKGQPVSILDAAAGRISLMPGAATLLSAMKADGASCWLVSGGFMCFARPVAERLGFDQVYANDLIIKDGIITGEVAEPILDKMSKKKLLETACATLNIPLSLSVAVGDGANDVPMLLASDAAGGLGIAYQAKPRVREAVRDQINYSDLTALLYAQGLSPSSYRR